MHSQALVIHKKDVKLVDVMYPYSIVDKDVDGRINDSRCRFFQVVPEKDISKALDHIGNKLQEYKNEYLEMLQYRAEHSYDEYKEKYGIRNCYSMYKHYCDCLEEYEQVKDLPNDNPKQIRFILDRYGWYNDDWVNLYIKGKGYGDFDNPYELWDFYTIVNEHRFAKYTYFLVTSFLVNQFDMNMDNYMELDKIDVERTVKNIEKLTSVWEYIIFCKDNPSDSVVYTDLSEKKEYREDRFFKVDNLDETLNEIKEQHIGEDYVVEAIDFHY